MRGGCGGPRRMTKATGGGKAANSNTFAPYSTGMNNCHRDPIPIYIHAESKTFHQTHRVRHKKASFPDRRRAKEKLRDGEGSGVASGTMAGYVGGDFRGRETGRGT
ncbi:hypothetical protein ACFX13_027713 [Malus domestica]